MQVLDSYGPEGFICHRCGFLLTHDPNSNQGGHEQSTRLNAQFRFITDLLPKIDQAVIPDNKFENALAAALPVQRDQTLNPASITAPVKESIYKPTAVKGLKNTGPTTVEYTLTTSDGPTAADRAAEQARKEQLAAQNALPAHFTHSTVTGEAINPLASQSSVIKSQPHEDDKKDALIGTEAADNGAEIDDFFARLKQQQAEEDAKEAEEEFETDDSDDEGFEDVVPGESQGSKVGTPLSSQGVDGGGSSVLGNNGSQGATLANVLQGANLNGVLKRPGGSQTPSGTSTGPTSPSGGTPDGERATKKVRIEEPQAPVVIKEEEESEEEPEFEDV
jgi:transcription initiation factor TFIIE subunit alpha